MTRKLTGVYAESGDRGFEVWESNRESDNRRFYLLIPVKRGFFGGFKPVGEPNSWVVYEHLAPALQMAALAMGGSDTIRSVAKQLISDYVGRPVQVTPDGRLSEATDDTK